MARSLKIIFCADGSLRQEKHAQLQTLRHQFRRWDPLQRARSDSLQEESGVAEDSEDDLDAVEAGGDFWTMSGENIYEMSFVFEESDVQGGRQLWPFLRFGPLFAMCFRFFVYKIVVFSKEIVVWKREARNRQNHVTV